MALETMSQVEQPTIEKVKHKLPEEIQTVLDIIEKNINIPDDELVGLSEESYRVWLTKVLSSCSTLLP